MKRFARIFTFSFFAGIVAAILDAFVLEHIFFDVRKYLIGNLQHGKKVIKILHLTDLHFRNNLSYKYRKLVRRINRMKPDIICITGDAIDTKGKAQPLEKFLRLLESRIPKVAILGNHEYASGVEVRELREVYQKVNCDLLINESKAYNLSGTRVMFTGLDDILGGHGDFKKAVEGVGHEEHHFALIHSPQHQDKIREQIKEMNRGRSGVDRLNIYVFFAGHNHGGQVKVGNFIPYMPPKSGDYVEGWYNDEKPYLYLSKGFGTSRVQVRFWARSEITLFMYYC